MAVCESNFNTFPIVVNHEYGLFDFDVKTSILSSGVLLLSYLLLVPFLKQICRESFRGDYSILASLCFSFFCTVWNLF